MSDTSGLEEAVKRKFAVRQSFVLPEGELEFQVEYGPDTKAKFEELSGELAPKGYVPNLGGTREECVLTVRKPEPQKRPQSRLPVILALFTLASVVVFALAEVLNYQQLAPSLPSDIVFVGFTAGASLLVGAHEFGQRFVARRRDAGHANSYLVPWLPFFPPAPSLGFVTTQREAAMNRDSLFDTVIAGPLVLLVLAVIIYSIGDLTSANSPLLYQWAHNGNASRLTNPNLIENSVDFILGPILPKAVAGALPVSPLADAATIGFILVFIGLLPMAFYDGGFLASMAWGNSAARAASFLSVVVLMVADTPTYWALAVFALLLAGRPFQIRLRDEVSELSESRRWVFLGTILLAFLCLPLPHNLGTLPLP